MRPVAGPHAKRAVRRKSRMRGDKEAVALGLALASLALLTPLSFGPLPTSG